MKKIKKAVIPAAGLGTRFLPATISVPKEMLPIVDKPVIQYVVEEAVRSGIEEILIIIRQGKEMIQNHFSPSADLVDALTKKGKIAELSLLDSIHKLAKITYVYQHEQKGLADAIYLAKDFVGQEPFAVLSGDTIISTNSSQATLSNMMEIFEETGLSVVATQWLEKAEDVERFGIVDINESDANRLSDGLEYYLVNGLVEKPKKADAPSRHGVVPMYIFSEDIFRHIEQTKIGAGGELQITDAMKFLAQAKKLVCTKINGVWHDVGNKEDFLKASLAFALKDRDLQHILTTVIKNEQN